MSEIQWFENKYSCPICKTKWADQWTCMCNDKCPKCDTETKPYESEEINNPTYQI